MRFPFRFLALAILAATSCLALAATVPSKSALAATPPMGWNSWNWFGKANINEVIVRETIDAMAANGLRDAGYNYIVVDGGWRDTKLGSNGELLAHPAKFPSGIKALADYAHARGFKFGLHVVPGTHDCGGDPIGGFGREEIHVRQLVDWGLDFVKLDRCRYDPGWEEAVVEASYRRWGTLLANCGRDILFNISAYRYREWYPEICHMSRTTGDITARVNGGAVFDQPYYSNRNFMSVMFIAELNDQVADFAGPGYWNDPDMMVTGPQGLSKSEQASHFALWCIMSSPLFIGSDPRTMDRDELALLTNRRALGINQDPTEQGRRLSAAGPSGVWAKRLAGGRAAVLLLNRDPAEKRSLKFDAKLLGLKPGWKARDVWSNAEIPVKGDSCTVEVPAGSSVFIVTE